MTLTESIGTESSGMIGEQTVRYGRRLKLHRISIAVASGWDAVDLRPMTQTAARATAVPRIALAKKPGAFLTVTDRDRS